MAVKNFPEVGILRSDMSLQMGRYMNEENQPEKIVLPEQNQSSLSRLPSVDGADRGKKLSFLRPQSVREVDQENLEQVDVDSAHIPVVPKSIVPSLRVFLQSHPIVLYKFLYRKIAESIRKESKETKLFYLGDKSILASLHFEDYGHVLNEAMKYFVGAEEYEMAGKCKEVLTGYYIEKVIHSTNSIKE